MQYKDGKKVYMDNLTEEEREIIDRLDGVWKDKFIEEYIHGKILYSGDENKEMMGKVYGYKDWQDLKVVMEE
jgi:hypothetical protein